MHTFRLPLQTTASDEQFLERQFNAMTHIHNVVVKHARKLLGRLRHHKEYQFALSEYRCLLKKNNASKGDALRKKELSRQMSDIRREIGLTEYALQSYAKVCASRYRKLVSSQQVQKECSRIYKGVEKVLFGNGKYLHFKKRMDFLSICGKTNTNGAKFDPEAYTLSWMGRTYRCRLPKNEADVRYMAESLDHRISYCEIVRMMFPSGWRYYVNIYLQGEAPGKLNKKIADDTSICGIDPGVSSIALCGDNGVMLQELAPGSAWYEKEIYALQQQMDRIRRSLNPDKYNADGTINRRNHEPWKLSKRYHRYRRMLKTLYRKKAAMIKQSHEHLANAVLGKARNVYVEAMNFAALAKRSKTTARQDTLSKVKGSNGQTRLVHKYKRRKRFGRSVSSRAPSSFLTILKRKCEQYGGSYSEINTMTFKASQYDHAEDICVKVPLSQREKCIGGHLVQRDLYSAFLIWNTDPSLKYPDREKCLASFDAFVQWQDAHIRSLKEEHVTMKQCFGF